MERRTEIIRDLAGIITVVTLLSMMVGQFLIESLYIDQRTFITLLSLISAFLGVDILRERRKGIIEFLRKVIQLIRELRKFYGQDK